jgi:hypothetical protein
LGTLPRPLHLYVSEVRSLITRKSIWRTIAPKSALQSSPLRDPNTTVLLSCFPLGTISRSSLYPTVFPTMILPSWTVFVLGVVQARPSSIPPTVLSEYAAHVRLQLAALVSWLGVARPNFSDYPSIFSFKSMAHSLRPFDVLHVEVEPPHRSSRRTRNKTEKMRDKCRTALTHDDCRLYPCSFTSIRSMSLLCFPTRLLAAPMQARYSL